MAKTSKSRKTPKKSEESDLLEPALTALAEGDYPAARELLQQIESDPALSKSQREMAAEYRSATWPERGAVLTAIGCVLFFGLVLAFAIAQQP